MLAGEMSRNRSHCMATLLPIKWLLHLGVVKAPFYNNTRGVTRFMALLLSMQRS
jgi:hypothetical protein